MSTFGEKVVLVTGGTRGIGRACALQFAKLGAKVAICGRDEDATQEAAKSIQQESGGIVKGYQAHVADTKSVDKLFEDLTESLGEISILVNNAGITRDGLLMRMKDDDWNEVIETNLTGAFNCCRAASRTMLKLRYGRIVTISSLVGLRGQSGQSNYAAAKAGLIGFSKSLAKEFASRSVTVNVVAPGFIKTDMTKDLADDIRKSLLLQVPFGREGEPGEVAEAVVFLASDAAAYITGQILLVDGGAGI